MAITETILVDDDRHRIVREEDPASGYVGIRTEWKPGTSEHTRASLHERAVAALDANAVYLALAAPTNAQNVAQVQRLTRECSGLIRLLLGRLDSTEGT